MPELADGETPAQQSHKPREEFARTMSKMETDSVGLRRWSTLPLRIILAAALIGATPHPASAGVFDDAQDVINQLNPINAALGPLIDRAIAQGNTAVAQ